MSTIYPNIEALRRQMTNNGVYNFPKSNSMHFDKAVNSTTHQDSVEISSKNNNKSKILLGLGTVGIIALSTILLLKGKKLDYISKAQKTFQGVFMRNEISKNETINLLKEYQEIYKIKDNEEFFNALFENAKKNFGLSHLNFKIERVNLPKSKIAAMGPDGTFTVNKNLALDRNSIINVIFHEFRHAKQNELMCSKDTSRYVSSIFERSKIMVKKKDFLYCNKLREIIKNMPNNETLTEKEIEQLVDDALENKWTKVLKEKLVDKLGLGKTQIPNDMDEYIEKCFEAHHKYSDGNFIGYFFNFLEKDARKSGEGMKKLLKSISNFNI